MYISFTIFHARPPPAALLSSSTESSPNHSTKSPRNPTCFNNQQPLFPHKTHPQANPENLGTFDRRRLRFIRFRSASCSVKRQQRADTIFGSLLPCLPNDV
ncbi:unnamed protein product, partial [Ectocarpus sp. 12 AP-2014]